MSVPDKEQNNDTSDLLDSSQCKDSSKTKSIAISVSHVSESEKSKKSNELRLASI